MKKVLNNKLIKGALLLSFGGFITKCLGAFYRIPLTNILGAEGIGLYQAVFPLYSLLLTVSSTGVPNGIAKIIAEENFENNAYVVLKSALKIFLPLGVIGSLSLAFFCKKLAEAQGESNSWLCYLTISPSVFLVSVISCFRGFFQGQADMKPTATSQVIEQAVKLVAGLTLCNFINGEFYLKAGLATLAVTISELVTLIWFLVKFNKKGYSLKGFKGIKSNCIKVFKIVLPVMISTIVIPVGRTIESFFILNILKGYTQNYTALYGLYTGAVESLVSVPVSICYAVAVTSVPIIASAKSKNENLFSKIGQSILLTLAPSVLFSCCFLFFSPLAVNILYNGLSAEFKNITVMLLKLSSVSVILLPLMQTTTSIIIAMGNAFYPPFSGAIGVTIKLVASVILLNNVNVNIFGAILSDILAYFVATFLNLLYIICISLKIRRNKKCTKLQPSV